jgi:hypothetical protein
MLCSSGEGSARGGLLRKMISNKTYNVSCGTTLHWELADLPDMIAVAVGAFADPMFLTPQVSVYGSRRHPWVDISGPVRHES